MGLGLCGGTGGERLLGSVPCVCGGRVKVIPLGFEWGTSQCGCLSVERIPAAVSQNQRVGKPLGWYRTGSRRVLKTQLEQWEYGSLT